MFHLESLFTFAPLNISRVEGKEGGSRRRVWRSQVSRLRGGRAGAGDSSPRCTRRGRNPAARFRGMAGEEGKGCPKAGEME